MQLTSLVEINEALKGFGPVYLRVLRYQTGHSRLTLQVRSAEHVRAELHFVLCDGFWGPLHSGPHRCRIEKRESPKDPDFALFADDLMKTSFVRFAMTVEDGGP